MNRLKLTIMCFLLCCLAPLPAYSWNAVGHRVVAQIAYNEVNPHTRAALDALRLRMGIENTSRVTYDNFASIAVWPDELIPQRYTLSSTWHYDDNDFSADGTPIPPNNNPHNIIWAIGALRPVVKNLKANPYVRARSLSYLVHFVGDAHQPLHCVSRVSRAHQDGDRGGNLYRIKYIKPNGTVIRNLHSLWDGGISLYDRLGFPSKKLTAEQIRRLALIISHEYPKYYFYDSQLKDMDPKHWCQKGKLIAQFYAYNTPEYAPPSNTKPPSDTYIMNNSFIVEQRLALAGYRLARMLDALF